MTRVTCLVLLSMLWLAQAPAARAAPPSLQGRAIQLGTSAPLYGAHIVAAKVGGPVTDYRTATTNTAGGFAFTDLVPGTYRIYAEREGYLQAEYGRRPVNTTGIPITLTDAQRVTDIIITMTPTGVIAGHVFDRAKPVRNVFVRALKAKYSDGGERDFGAAEWTQTDDTGAYRLIGLAPGPYIVSAMPDRRPRIDGDMLVTPTIPSNANSNRSELRSRVTADELTSAAFDRSVYMPVYYPGATEIGSATPIDVRPGSIADGIDLTIARTSGYRIRGRVETPVTLADAESRLRVTVIPVDFASARSDQTVPNPRVGDGSFELSGVVPGRYYLVAETLTVVQEFSAPVPRAPAVPRMVAVVPIRVVDGDLDAVNVVLQAGVTVTGRVTVEGASLTGALVQLVPVPFITGLGSSAVPVRPDGTFSVQNVAPYTYRVRVMQAGRQTWIKRARYGVDDALTMPMRIDNTGEARPLEILLSTNTATLDAQVVDSAQRPAAGVLVVAVPDQARRNRSELYRTGNTDANGRVHIEGIGAGEYRLFATGEIEAASWQDPDVIRIYESRGELAHFEEGRTENLTLRVMP